MELDASIGRRKSPLDRRLLAVANALPLVDSLLHLFETCHAFTQRLASQHRQFNLSHIQPTPMHRRGMNF